MSGLIIDCLEPEHVRRSLAIFDDRELLRCIIEFLRVRPHQLGIGLAWEFFLCRILSRTLQTILELQLQGSHVIFQIFILLVKLLLLNLHLYHLLKSWPAVLGRQHDVGVDVATRVSQELDRVLLKEPRGLLLIILSQTFTTGKCKRL